MTSEEIARLPPRLTTSEFCALARCTARTIQRRIKDGTYQIKPLPDRGAQNLWSREQVLTVLGITRSEAPPRKNTVSIEAMRAEYERNRRRRAPNKNA